MAKKKATKDIQPVRQLVTLTDEVEMLMLCKSITHLKLDPTCHMDRKYAKDWYEKHYITGIHARYVMKPGLTINHVGDGIVYRAFNCTDAIAVRIMKENKDYVDYFEDLGEFVMPGADVPTVIPEVEEDKPTVIPEVEEDKPTVIPEVEEPKEEEAPADPEAPKEEAPEDDKVLEDLEKELNEEK
jgi:hypothetical protein